MDPYFDVMSVCFFFSVGYYFLCYRFTHEMLIIKTHHRLHSTILLNC